MTDFRGTDRIRKAAAVIRRQFRRIRFISLKGITIVRKKLLPKTRLFIRDYRSPIAVTVVAALGVATVAVAGQQYVKANMQDYYQVYVNGSPVGDISSSAKVEQWLAAKAEELQRADTPVLEELDEDQVEYRPERAYKWQPNDEATLAALSSRVTTHPIGVEVKVRGITVGVVRDRKAADQLLARIKGEFIPEDAKIVLVSSNASANKSAAAGPRIQTLAFNAASTAQAADLTEADTNAGGNDTPSRVVKDVQIVDSVSVAKVKLPQAKLSDPEAIYRKLIGDEEAPPLLGVRSVEEVTQIEPIAAKTEYRDSKDLRKGTSKVLRNGQDGQKQVTYKQVKMNGEVTEEEIVAEQVLKEPVSKIVLNGTKVIAGEGTGKFAWPVSGHRLTSKMGKRWGTMHNGIDMIGRSTIKAADNGVVESVTYSKRGLGNHVVINHRNGFKTVYGHMKSISVKKGQIVEKGEKLGIMGSTGHSTGTHLHFEIHQNGKVRNPLNYLK